MPDTTTPGWERMATLPTETVSFAGVSYDEMVRRARELRPALAARAEECERLRRMPEATERDLHRTGLFRITQPARVGGAELDVGIFVDACAQVARVCPSTAWNLGNLSSHHWMLGFFDPRAQQELWEVSRDVLIATSLIFPNGRGRKVEGGWEVSGRWPLSSGVDNCDWNMLGYQVREHEGGPVVDTRFALVHRSQYKVYDTWKAVGLCGTGSNDVEVRNLFVPEHRTLSVWQLTGGPHPGSAVNTGPLFRLPMLALGPYVLSGVMLGCAQGAYDSVVTAARKRNATNTGAPLAASQPLQIKVAEAGARIDAAEMLMRQACAHAMQQARAGRTAELADKVRYRRDAAFAVRLCREAVDLLMGIAGSGGLYEGHIMHRLFRDAAAAHAHVMFSPEVQGTLFGQHELGFAGPPPLV